MIDVSNISLPHPPCKGEGTGFSCFLPLQVDLVPGNGSRMSRGNRIFLFPPL
ncbi:MAG: hypothetical protein V7K94_25135 [Nostoc sp.]